MCLGQAHGGDAEEPVGVDSLVYIARIGSRTRCPVGCQRLGYWKSVCRDTSGQDVFVNGLDRVIGH